MIYAPSQPAPGLQMIIYEGKNLKDSGVRTAIQKAIAVRKKVEECSTLNCTMFFPGNSVPTDCL